MESFVDNNVENVGLRLPSAKESIEFASKLLRRKIPQAGHLLTPRRLWMQTVPTVECDVVIVTSPGISDNMLMWLLSKLKASGGIGLNVHVKQHGSTDSYLFYITAPFNLLLNCAEKLHLPKRVIQECGGGLKEFVQSEAHLFQCIENKENFFTMPERQWLIHHLLETLRAQNEECVEILHLIPGQAIIPKCVSQEIIHQIFPLHDMPALKQLRMSWVRAFLDEQPIDNICDYFGVKIAMYFAWLGHYTTSLIVPAIVGFVFWVGFGRGDQTNADVGFVLFSFFNVIWFSVYIEAWKRYSAELAYKWGTLDQRDELLLEPRPLFTGTLEVSSVTGRLEPTYPAWKRNMFRYFVSLPIIALCISLVFVIMIVSFIIQDWWDTRINDYNYPFFLSFIPKILLAVVISILDEAYFKVACWLNDQENYRLETKYENNLIIKVSMFQFVNSFISLFYIAFYLQDQERLKVQLAVLLITRQIICNIKESALPYLIEQFRLAKLSFDMFGALSPTEAGVNKWKDEEPLDDNQLKHAGGSNRIISQAELESTLFKYEGTFSEHLEMFIQLGYVILFSSAFPMAAFLALLNNLLEIRSDAFKMCFVYQRPFIQRVANIGMWQNIMKVMGFIAVLVNCALIALSGQVHRMFPDMSKTQTILLIVCLEHIMLMIRFLISCAIPDLPEWVATEMAKTEFARREATRLSFANTTPPPATTNAAPPADEVSIGRFVVAGSKSSANTSANNNNNNNNNNNIGIDLSADSELLTVSASTTKGVNFNYNDRNDAGVKNGKKYQQAVACPDYNKGDNVLTSAVSSMQLTKDWVESTGLPSDYDYHVTVNAESGLSCWKNNPKDALRRRFHLLENNPQFHRSAVCLPSSATALSSVTSERKQSPMSVVSSSQSTVNLSSQSSSGVVLVNRPPLSHHERFESTTGSDSSSVAEESGSLTDPSPSDGKKGKLKTTFIKRARSVAIFSLKLKERRAKAEKSKDSLAASSSSPKVEKPIVAGELSCLPIEMLVSLDDLQRQQFKRTSASNSSKPSTPVTGSLPPTGRM